MIVFNEIIDQILEANKLVHKKQRHTSKRIIGRLHDEYCFEGGITIVNVSICAARQRPREMFVPLFHPPGDAQADFGEAFAIIGSVVCKVHFLVMGLPNTDTCFVKANPGETVEVFRDSHVAALELIGSVPTFIPHDKKTSQNLNELTLALLVHSGFQHALLGSKDIW